MKRAVAVTGVWLRRRGFYAEVLVEVGGHWVKIIGELAGDNFSHIAEGHGIVAAARKVGVELQPVIPRVIKRGHR